MPLSPKTQISANETACIPRYELGAATCATDQHIEHTPLRGGLLAGGALHSGVSTETSGRTLQEKRGSEGGGRRRRKTQVSVTIWSGATLWLMWWWMMFHIHLPVSEGSSLAFSPSLSHSLMGNCLITKLIISCGYLSVQLPLLNIPMMSDFVKRWLLSRKSLLNVWLDSFNCSDSPRGFFSLANA